MKKGKRQLHMWLQRELPTVQVWYLPALPFDGIKWHVAVVEKVWILLQVVWNTSRWPESVGTQKDLQHQDLQPSGIGNLCPCFSPAWMEPSVCGLVSHWYTRHFKESFLPPWKNHHPKVEWLSHGRPEKSSWKNEEGLLEDHT